MKRKLLLLTIALGLGLSANAQIESLKGPRIGAVLITQGLTADMINTKFDIDMEDDIIGETGSAFVSLYGWQWESRFADGGNITGIVEWIALVGGMEKGLFLPSVSSLVGMRTESGLEFAMGPNLSLSGIALVIGAGYNFKSGDLNMPVNIAFVPGKSDTREGPEDAGPDGEMHTDDDFHPDVNIHTGNRFSITVGFNLSK